VPEHSVGLVLVASLRYWCCAAYLRDAFELTLIRAHGEVAGHRARLGIRFINLPDRQLLKRLFCLVILNGLCG